MRALLVCPSDRASAGFLARLRPLALAPVLGRSLIQLALAHLAQKGHKSVLILAADRPEQIRAAVQRENLWAQQVEVLAERAELTAAEALAKHGPADEVLILDHVPGSPEDGLWRDPADFLRRLQGLLTTNTCANRVTMRELSPGVFVSVLARVSPSARLNAPCWIGPRAWIGDQAVVGPGSIIEEGACVDPNATVADSFVGPGTYVGGMTEIRSSLAWGNGLYKAENGSFLEVVDDFLLCDLAHRHVRAGWPGRLAALLLMLITWPVAVIGALFSFARGRAILSSRRVIAAPVSSLGELNPTVTTHGLAGFNCLLKRWPELWNVVAGEFRLIGNRPVTPERAATFSSDFDLLWLAVPPGVFSLADSHGVDEAADESLAHSAFYAAHPSLRGDLSILWACLPRLFSKTSQPSP